MNKLIGVFALGNDEDEEIKKKLNLVKNGTFDSYADWFTATGIDILEGRCVYSDVAVLDGVSQIISAIIVGRTYHLKYEITDLSYGWINAVLGNSDVGIVVGNYVGVFEGDLVAQSQVLYFEAGGISTLKIDNVELYII